MRQFGSRKGPVSWAKHLDPEELRSTLSSWRWGTCSEVRRIQEFIWIGVTGSPRTDLSLLRKMGHGLNSNGVKALAITFGVDHDCPENVNVDLSAFVHTSFNLDRLIVTVITVCPRTCEIVEKSKEDEERVRVSNAVEAKINAEILRVADVLIGKPHRSTACCMDRGYLYEDHGQTYEVWSMEVTRV